MKHSLSYAAFLSAVGVAAILAPACGDKNGPSLKPPTHKPIDGSGMGGMGGGMGMGGAVLMPVSNCGAQACEGEGAICGDVLGTPTCQCAGGYILNKIDGGYECIVDKTCVKLRYLEAGCRVEMSGAPAVGMFFGADYCAGTAVLPADIGNLATAFHITEDGKELTVEAEAALVSRDVESYVGIVLDVSRSVQENDALLSQVTNELKAFVDELQPAPGKPPVYISVMVFARDFGVLVPFTTDVAALKDKLTSLYDDPMGTITPALKNYTGKANIDGTSLWQAVGKGIVEVEAAQKFRNLVTDNGVLSSGTLVVITDGEDTNNESAVDTPELAKTAANVISFGVSPEIQGSTLAAIGRDGAFLGTTADARTLAFASIAKRVKEHPERTYMLGYCSAASAGFHKVSISLADQTITTSPAVCEFDASIFGGEACSAQLFATACDANECGSIYACGGCADDQCCSNGKCSAPSYPTNCGGGHSMCPPNQRCEFVSGDIWQCVDALQVGDPCSTNTTLCKRGSRCDLDASDKLVCLAPTIPDNASCLNETGTFPLPAQYCESGNCQRFNPTTAYCDPDPPRAGDACETNQGQALCGTGYYCNLTCQPRLPDGLATCTRNEECGSGVCNTGTKLCDGPVCTVSWNQVRGK